VFSDEAHFDPSAQQAGFILREEGTRLEPENIQMRGKKTGVVLHVAGWCNWRDMAPELTFYHDEESHIQQHKRPPKPRQSKYEDNEQFKLRLDEWEALPPHPVEVKPQGNSMTGKYYSEQILPNLVTAIHNLRQRFDLKGWDHEFVLQEDNNKSHGHTLPHRPNSLQDRLKSAANINTVEHPPRSPDVNPQEAVWNILKARVKKRTWNGIKEYRRVIQEEYSQITLLKFSLHLPSKYISFRFSGQGQWQYVVRASDRIYLESPRKYIFNILVFYDLY
jgi:hypothetical protein